MRLHTWHPFPPVFDAPLRLRTFQPLKLSRTFTNTSLRLPKVPFPLIPTCPSPTCACAPFPTLKKEIDHTRPLTNSIAPYAQHVLVSTGQHNWSSRIENSPNTPWGSLTTYLKHELGPKGDAFDPSSSVLVTTSSFVPGGVNSAETSPKEQNGSILLFPSFQHYENLKLSPTALPGIISAIRGSSSLLPYTLITTPTVLVCSHNSRDSRCGILGPILQEEFVKQLGNLGLNGNVNNFLAGEPDSVNVGCISHVGGHAWAGNVIIYMPENTPNDLAGTGVWYGRVEPRHVEGIIKETVLGGRVIKELWRGGIGRDGKIIRI